MILKALVSLVTKPRCHAWIPLLAILLLGAPWTATRSVTQETTANPTNSSDELPWNRKPQRSPRPPAETEISAQMFLQQKDGLRKMILMERRLLFCVIAAKDI